MLADARDAGHQIARSTFLHYANENWTNPPTANAMFAIAAAIDVGPDEVLIASGVSIGIPFREVRPTSQTRAIIALLADRTPEQVTALEQVVRTVATAMDAGGATPGTGPDPHPE